MASRRALRLGPVLAAALAYVGGCDWTLFGFDAANTRFNISDNPVSASNVATLIEKWRASVTPIGRQTVVSGNRVFARVDLGPLGEPAYRVVAYSADGTTGCTSGTPKTCNPLRIYRGPDATHLGIGEPSILDNVLYASSTDSPDDESPTNLYAFDANGSTHCNSGTKECTPIRIYSTEQSVAGNPAVVSDGVLYVTSSGGFDLYAFSADGSSGCDSGSPRLCQPLWKGYLPQHGVGGNAVAVSGGRVYAAAGAGVLTVFDAAGQNQCGGSPKICAPLWTSIQDGGEPTTPTVYDGLVYMGNENGYLYAYDAAGAVSCSGAPKTCVAVWRAAIGTGGGTTSMVAAGAGQVHVSGFPGPYKVFAADGGTSCTPPANVCSPLWTANAFGTPNVSHNLTVIADELSGRTRVFDAAGVAGCSGSPKVCGPLWSSPPDVYGSSAVMANGRLFVTALDSATGPAMIAYGLP